MFHQTNTLTTGQDIIAGTSGNDTILAFQATLAFASNVGFDFVDGTYTLTLGDKIDGGAGVDTLRIDFNDTYTGKLNLAVATISNVENLYIRNIYDDFDRLNIANNKFSTVTIDYDGTGHEDNLYINNINGQTTLVIDNVVGVDEYYFYRNYDGKYDGTEGAVSVTNTIKNFDAVSQDDYSYFEGYEYFSKATTVNHTLNLQDIDGGDEGFKAYEYIEAKADKATINTTVNVSNADTPGSYTRAYIEVYNGVSVDVADTVNATVNIVNSDGVDIYLDSANSGVSGKSDVITYNIDGLKSTHNRFDDLSSAGFETITLNVGANGAATDEFDDNDTIEGNQAININAAGNFKANDTYFDGTVKNVTVTVTGAGNVDLGNARLGDGGATDVVTVNASASTGNFKVYDSNGYAATITSGSGDDNIRVGGFKTAVTTGAGDDFVDAGTFDFGDAAAKKLDGGEGTDTIRIRDSANLDAGYAANISGFEVLDIASSSGSFDMALEAELGAVTQIGGATTGNVTITKAKAGTTVTVSSAKSTDLSDGNILSFGFADASGSADVATFTLNAVDGDDDGTAVGEITYAQIVLTNDAAAKGIETIKFVSNATPDADDLTTSGVDESLEAGDYTNTVTLLNGTSLNKVLDVTANAGLTITTVDANLTALATIKVAGAGDFEITDALDAATKLTSVDASGSTGDVYIDASANTVVINYKGSAGDDKFYAGTKGDTIYLGTGEDYASLWSSSSNATSVADTIILKSGADSVIADSSEDGKFTLAADDGWDVIEYFETVTIAGDATLADKLDVTTFNFSAYQRGVVDVTSKVTDTTDLKSVTDLFADAGGDRGVAFAIVNGDTVVLVDSNKDGNFTAADDLIIQLVGVTGLTGTVLAGDFIA